MAGGGIRTSNVRTLALKTGVREVHTSLSKSVKGLDELGSYRHGNRSYCLCEADVRTFKAALEGVGPDTKTGVPLQ